MDTVTEDQLKQCNWYCVIVGDYITHDLLPSCIIKHQGRGTIKGVQGYINLIYKRKKERGQQYIMGNKDNGLERCQVQEYVPYTKLIIRGYETGLTGYFLYRHMDLHTKIMDNPMFKLY